MALATSTIEPSRRTELALADERVIYDWSMLDGILNRATNALLAVHPPVRRIAVCAPNCVETVVAYVAGLQAGVSSTPTSYLFKARELAHIFADSEATVLFVGPETVMEAMEAARMAGLKAVVGWRCTPRADLILWQDWLASASAQEPPTNLRPAPHLHYTSGTTGKPKPTETPPSQFPPAETVAELATILHSRMLPSPGLVVG